MVTFSRSLVLSLCILCSLTRVTQVQCAHPPRYLNCPPNSTQPGTLTHYVCHMCSTPLECTKLYTFSWDICEQVMIPDHQHFLLSPCLWWIICKSTHTWPVQCLTAPKKSEPSVPILISCSQTSRLTSSNQSLPSQRSSRVTQSQMINSDYFSHWNTIGTFLDGASLYTTCYIFVTELKLGIVTVQQVEMLHCKLFQV